MPNPGTVTTAAMASRLDPASAKAMVLSFRTRRWRWYWAMAATLIGGLLVFAFMVGNAVAFANIDNRGATDALLRPGMLTDYLVILIAWPMLAAAGLLALRLVKGDPMRRAFTSSGTFTLRDFAKTAAAILIVYVAGSLLTYLFTPQDFARPPRAPEFYGWLVFGLFVILVQSASEEIFFRGFLFRVWGAVMPFPWLASALVMAVFISMHIPNPDMQRDLVSGLCVFVGGEVIAYAALLRTKTLAASMGLHWANNIFAFFMLASEPLGDADAAVFVYTDPVYSAGGTHALDPAAYAMNIAAVVSLALLLFWARSPLCLPRRAVA